MMTKIKHKTKVLFSMQFLRRTFFENVTELRVSFSEFLLDCWPCPEKFCLCLWKYRKFFIIAGVTTQMLIRWPKNSLELRNFGLQSFCQ